jgi:hypothetical protein
MSNSANNRQAAIMAIAANYQGVSVKQIEALIEATNGINGVSFVSLKGYSSDKSGNTEVADQLVNIGASYANMLTKDVNIYANFDLSKVDVNKFNYETIDTGKLTLEQFKQAVKEALPIALSELNQPKAKKDTSADIWLNKALVFNLNTMRLSVFGQSINKVVETKGTFKVVKSAPKTVAKRLIEKQARGKAQMLRRFTIDNFNGSIKASGETIEIA